MLHWCSIILVCLRCGYLDGCFAVVMMADALPPLFRSARWILCCPCYSYFGGCFAAVFALLIGRLWWMLRRYGAAYSGGCLATHWLFSWSVGGLGDVVVGSSVLGCLAGWWSLLFCGRCSASTVAVCFRWSLFQFFLCCYSFVCLCRSTTVWLASSYVCNLLPS